jgi:glycosyltransferase involved in cell wall biosynthesis
MREEKKLNGLWIGKTGESNAWYHIFPFVNAFFNNKLFVVRHKRPQRDILSSRIEFITFSSKGNIGHLWSMFSNGFKVLRTNKIDYIVSFSLVPWGIIGWVLAKLFRKKIIIGLIGSDYNQHVEKSKFAFIFKYILKSSNVITTTGSVMNLSVEEKTKHSNVQIFPHCLPDDLFYDKELKKSKTLKLISISELSKNKRTIDIIHAVEKLVNKGIDVKLDVLGIGSQLEYIEKYIFDKNLDNYITLVGYVKDIKTYLKKADIFVQASLKEGLSLSLIESIGMGLIPVVTLAGSEKDLITNNLNGLFFEKKNPKDLADKIELLYNEKEYIQFFESVKKIKEKLKIEYATKKVEDILSKL